MHYGFSPDEDEVIQLFGRLAVTAEQTLEPRTGPDTDFWAALVDGGWLEAWALREAELSETVLVGLGIELGRACPAVPWTTVFGYVGTLLADLDSEAAVAHRERLRAGELITAAWRGGSAVRGESAGENRIRLDGHVDLVASAADAAVILIPVQSDGGIVLVAVSPDGEGVEVSDAPAVDLRHRFADLRFDGAEADVIAPAGERLDRALAAARRRLSLLFTAEAVGGLARLVDDAVRYTTDRTQFGVPIGSFQAVKHHIAHVATTLENGRALAYLAASTLGDRTGDDGADIAAAREYTARNYLLGAEQIIQVHGGFGFTWDAGRHVGYRNAMVNVRSMPDAVAV